MSLRPIEAMGVDRVVEFLRLQQFGPVTWLPDRMPWPPKGRPRMPDMPRKFVVLADPLAVYVLAKVEQADAPAGAVGLGIYVPHKDMLEDGFLHQRFLVHMDGRQLQAWPQGTVVHTSGCPVEPGIMLVRSDGPSAVSDGLASELPHAIAALIHTTKREEGAA